MSLVRPTKFAHVVYRTRRFAEMLEWYETVFGAVIQYQNPGLAFMTYDDEHHRFALINLAFFQPDGSDTDRRGAIGVDHVAYAYGSLRDLLENYDRLKQKGIIPYWRVHHGISASLYYADPDGNQMEFQIDSFDNSEAANEFMSSYFAQNPIGVEFDPDDWLAQLRAGTPESEFVVRRGHDPVSPIRGHVATILDLPQG